MSSTRGDWRESLGRELTVRPVVHGCTAADVHSETQAEDHTPPCHHAMDLSLSLSARELVSLSRGRHTANVEDGRTGGSCRFRVLCT